MPGDFRTKSELSPHQMAHAGVVPHSSSTREECKKVQSRHFLIELLREEVDIVLWTVTNGEDDATHLRLDVADFRAFQAPKRAKSISLSKCPIFPTIGLYFLFFMRSKVMMLKLHVEEAKMSISERCQWPPPWAVAHSLVFATHNTVPLACELDTRRTHRYSVELETTLLVRNASLPHGETESTSCG